jgi:HAD superfamily hydrolase (TIGR01662 family)
VRSRAFDVVFFDLGHTLIYTPDDFPKILERASRVLAHSLWNAGLIRVEDQFLRLFNLKRSQLFRERDVKLIEYTLEYILVMALKDCGIYDPAWVVMQNAMTAMLSSIHNNWLVEPDALQTLEILHSDGYQLGLISNSWANQDVMDLVDRFDLRRFFPLILSSASVGVRKPHPIIFQQALRYFRIRPEQAVMVGDMPEADIVGAHRSGMAGIWITRRVKNQDDIQLSEESRPDATISSLQELAQLLFGFK